MIKDIRKLNLSKILSYVFGDYNVFNNFNIFDNSNRIEESMIDGNLSLFKQFLCIFGDNFNLLRLQLNKGERKFYIKQAIIMCHEDSYIKNKTRDEDFKEIRGKFINLLKKIEKEESTQFSPN